MPVADALAAILAGAEPLPEEMVALDAGHRRVLARDLEALRTQPPQAMSAMDGYAVRATDAAQAGAKFKVIGEVAAGRPFDRAVGHYRRYTKKMLKAAGPPGAELVRLSYIDSVGLLASIVGLFLGLGLAKGLNALFVSFGIDLPKGATRLEL